MSCLADSHTACPPLKLWYCWWAVLWNMNDLASLLASLCPSSSASCFLAVSMLVMCLIALLAAVASCTSSSGWLVVSMSARCRMVRSGDTGLASNAA